jgi:hypothetical protein
MTAHAVGEVADALFPVFLGDIALAVLVAVVAVVAGVGSVAVGMAGRTVTAGTAVVHREAMWPVVGSRAPGAGQIKQRVTKAGSSGMVGGLAITPGTWQEVLSSKKPLHNT